MPALRRGAWATVSFLSRAVARGRTEVACPRVPGTQKAALDEPGRPSRYPSGSGVGVRRSAHALAGGRQLVGVRAAVVVVGTGQLARRDGGDPVLEEPAAEACADPLERADPAARVRADHQRLVV